MVIAILSNQVTIVRVPADQPRDLKRKEEDLANAILRYLAEHPNAQDTAEGIASFWVMRQRVKEDVKEVLSVLRQLTRSGQLERLRRGGYVLYRLKKEGSDEDS